MTILVDQARWAWRDTTWCHLVTDDHLDELHAFAGELGCRRVGFQGDHYDIDIDMRRVAIANGAIECDSRELVRRLKAAGLRMRPSAFAKWELDYRIDARIDHATWKMIRERHPHVENIREIDASTVGFERDANGIFVLHRGRAQAVVVHGMGTLDFAIEEPSVGVFARQDHRRVWAVESISPPPSANQ